jgi:hypothetical protein
MSNKQQPSSSIWTTLFKVLIFIIALYVAFIILRPLLALLLGISFWLIKLIVFIAAAFFVIHFALKIIFQIDLIRMIFGGNWRR